MFIADLLDPKNDYVFKRIFGYIGNEDITKDLLNCILDTKIEEITLDCKEILEQDLQTDKFGILDIKAKINNEISCDIEMQVSDNKDIEDRLLFYWSSMYNKQIELGDRYINLKKTIVILFSNYELKRLNKIKKYLTKWQIRESEYQNIILTKNLEIYIIEIPKFEEQLNNNTKLDTWVKFIINPEVIDMNDIEKNEALKKAKEILEEISSDEKERELAFRRKLAIMDQKALRASGYDEGHAIGKKEGKIEGKKEDAKQMLKEGLDIELIIKITGLTKDEIAKLK